MIERRERGSARDVLFVDEYYYPDGWGGAELQRDITLHLAAQGYRVAVLCGSEPYAPVLDDPGPSPAVQGVRIDRVPLLRPATWRKSKLLRHIWFYLVSGIRLLVLRTPRLFIAQTTPPLIVVIVAIASRMRRRPMMIVAQDLYPEALVAAHYFGDSSWINRLLRMIFRWGYRQASAVVSVGEAMRQRLIAKGVPADRVVLIPNWATGLETTLGRPETNIREEWGINDRFVIMYSGNMGVGHEFETLLDALTEVAPVNRRVLTIFVGRGSRLSEIKVGVENRKLQPLVQFHDFVPTNRLSSLYRAANLSVVTTRPGFDGLIVPSKLMGYMARALTVLYIGPNGDTQLTIERAHCGGCFPNGDSHGVAKYILEAANQPDATLATGRSGFAYYEAKLSRPIGLAKYSRVVATCLLGR